MEKIDARKLSTDAQQQVRYQVIRLRKQGRTHNEISAITGVSRSICSTWWNLYKNKGKKALKIKKRGRPTGSCRKLDQQQEKVIQKAICDKCPDQLKLPFALWTRIAVQQLIKQLWGMEVPIRTIGDYLKRWNFTPQKPLKRAYEQNPKAVQRWLDEEYPTIKQKAKKEDAEIHWGDETGVRSTCHVGRGYAPKSETPELKLPGNRFSVNMISTVTNQGKVRFMIYEGRMTAALFIVFLARLIRYADAKILLIVDNLSLHDAIVVREWLVDRNDQIELFFLPKYAPELNPDEYLNCDLKAGVNAKGLPTNREHLKANLMSFMQRLAKLPARVASYFQNRHIHYAAADATL